MSIESDATDLGNLALAQLDSLARDFMQPDAVREKAQELRAKIQQEKLVAAINDFEAATVTFTDLTRQLLDITEVARRNPGGDAVGVLTPIIRQTGAILAAVTGPAAERSEPAGSPDDNVPPPDDTHVPQPQRASAQKGRAINSTKYADIADEYIAAFNGAVTKPDKEQTVTRMCRVLVSYKDRYEGVGRPMGIPWHFVGLIHALESGFNFAGHLHNGDSLAHRTTRVPAGRPPATVADPPFAWSTSAIDALQYHRLGQVSPWTLSRQLFELERYNGFGYRFRGLASPYLWSFSDQYIGGKFIRDRVFDPDAVSQQAGAAVLLKKIIDLNVIVRPAD